MIDIDTFKAGATKFRRNAKRMGVNRRMSTLLDIYAYAHFGRPYSVMHNLINTRHVPAPAFPPTHLEAAGEKWGLDPALILEAMEVQPPRERPAVPGEELTVERLAELLSRFQDAASQLDLGEAAADDLFCRAYLDCPLDDVLAALEAGESVEISPTPEYLVAACAFLDVSVRQAMAAFGRVGR
jgi:hypothetical protein